MALTGFTDICESFPPFQIKSSRWDESKLKIQRTFLEVFPPDTVLPSVSPPRVIFTFFFFFAYFSRVIRWSEHFQQSFPKKNKTNIYSFYIKSAQKTKNKNQTFTLSARIWTQRCDSDFAQGCKISLESLDGVHVSLTVWPSPTQRPVDALIINCIAKNNPTTRLSSSGGGWSLLGNMHTQSESLPPTASNHTLLLLRSVCKNKKGSKSRRSNWGGAAAEAQNTERRLGRISEVDICSFSPLQVASGERRHHRMSTWTNQVAPFLIKMVKPIS